MRTKTPRICVLCSNTDARRFEVCSSCEFRRRGSRLKNNCAASRRKKKTRTREECFAFECIAFSGGVVNALRRQHILARRPLNTPKGVHVQSVDAVLRPLPPLPPSLAAFVSDLAVLFCPLSSLGVFIAIRESIGFASPAQAPAVPPVAEPTPGPVAAPVAPPTEVCWPLGPDSCYLCWFVNFCTVNRLWW